MAVSLELQVGVATASAATATVTFGAVSGSTFYLTGIVVTGLGATSAGSTDITSTGLKGSTQITITIPVVAGATVANTPFYQPFGEKGYPASAQNTAVAISVATFGSGNTKATLVCWGYYA